MWLIEKDGYIGAYQQALVVSYKWTGSNFTKILGNALQKQLLLIMYFITERLNTDLVISFILSR